MLKIFRWSSLCACLVATTSFAADLPKPLVSGLKNPESVCLGPDGAIYVTEIGEFDKPGDGLVTVIRDGKATPFAKGLDDPKGIVAADNQAFYVTDKTKVVKVDLQGNVTTFAAPDAFPVAPKFLNDIAYEPESTTLFVSDSGNLMGKEGAVYSINTKTGKVETVVDTKSLPALNTPNGLALDGASHLLLLDFGSGDLYRIKLADKSFAKISQGFDGGDGLTWDYNGRLFISSWKSGNVWGIPRPGQDPILLTEAFEQAADTCIDPSGKFLLVPDMKVGTITALPTNQIPGWEVDVSPLSVTLEPAFPNVEWTGWSAEDKDGRVAPFHPILLTHAGDGTNRVFVPTQEGFIHVLPNDDKATKSTVFLDISSKVRYIDKQPEEGLLGLAFHPDYKKNGEFFVFYTDVKEKFTNVVSRFRVSKTNPNVADPASEEELMRFNRPFWNHDGGTILFGPDGYLYITHGDGGFGGDPEENGQNLGSTLGKVLRIDINKKSDGKNYAIPADNPFVKTAGARPEVWAYGLRNIWRMSIDRKTGQLWSGEVGQNLFEEINILTAGGNYGWNLRESLHPFGPKGVDVNDKMIEPLWEYHHDVGKSITGGLVYRGKNIPELDGSYLYADYVSARMWALWYDADKGRVVANREIVGQKLPVPSFGEDEMGEAYILIFNTSGKGIFRLTKGK